MVPAKKERAYAIGWVNSATTIGVILTAPTLWLFMTLFGFDWRETFIYTGIFGVILLLLWLRLYSNPRESGKVGAAELAWIEHDPPEKVERIGWGKIVTKREGMGLCNRQIPDRSGLVPDALPATQIFQHDLRRRPESRAAADDRHVSALRRRQHPRRLGIVEADPERAQRQFRAQGHDDRR